MVESRGNLEMGISRARQQRGRVFGGPQSKTDGGRVIGGPQSRTDGGRAGRKEGTSIKKMIKRTYDRRKENSTHTKSKMDGLQRPIHTNADTRHRK